MVWTQIRRELFNTERPPVAQAPPDTDKHRVTIYLSGKEYQLDVQYPDTILAAAKKVHISLPYSCAAGRCSGCVAKCTHGEVWMAYNEVLTEKEIRQGMVLTCVGFPVSGDVTISYNLH